MKNISDNLHLITNTLGVFGTFCTTGEMTQRVNIVLTGIPRFTLLM